MHTFQLRHFRDNLVCSLKNLLSKDETADVTLVSDDLTIFSAHKFVLSSFSPVFKDLLLNNPHPQPMIYLRGINKFELDSIIQFLYSGTAQFYHQRMEKFFETAKDLKIHHLSQLSIQNDQIIIR